MPLQQYYANLEGTRIFETRAEYLDYLRTRHRHRVAQGKLGARREIARQRLSAVKDCANIEQLTDFLNEHRRDISLLTRDYREEEIVEIGFARMAYREESRWHPAGWHGALWYTTRHIGHRRGREIRDLGWGNCYDLHVPHYDPSYSDVLKSIGIKTGSGSGISTGAGKDGLGHMKYEVSLAEVDFDHMRVMARIAA